MKSWIDTVQKTYGNLEDLKLWDSSMWTKTCAKWTSLILLKTPESRHLFGQ